MEYFKMYCVNVIEIQNDTVYTNNLFIGDCLVYKKAELLFKRLIKQSYMKNFLKIPTKKFIADCLDNGKYVWYNGSIAITTPLVNNPKTVIEI